MVLKTQNGLAVLCFGITPNTAQWLKSGFSFNHTIELSFAKFRADTLGNFKDGYLGKLSDGGQNPCG
jgi:hypothetical protein